MSVGRNGGNGTLTVDNATLNLNGQQTAGNLVGANLSIGLGGDAGGLGGGTGMADIKDGSTVNITNYTAVGNVGANPLARRLGPLPARQRHPEPLGWFAHQRAGRGRRGRRHDAGQRDHRQQRQRHCHLE